MSTSPEATATNSELSSQKSDDGRAILHSGVKLPQKQENEPAMEEAFIYRAESD